MSNKKKNPASCLILEDGSVEEEGSEQQTAFKDHC